MLNAVKDKADVYYSFCSNLIDPADVDIRCFSDIDLIEKLKKLGLKN